MVERVTDNYEVEGSIPSARTIKRVKGILFSIQWASIKGISSILCLRQTDKCVHQSPILFLLKCDTIVFYRPKGRWVF